MDESSKQLLEFLKTIEQFKRIKREVFYADGVPESDAEHVWHMAMFAVVFDDKLPASIDRMRLMRIILIHDLVEIYAGDTFAFDKEGQVGKKEREQMAAERLFSQLPDDLSRKFMQLFHEFEMKSSPEGAFAQSFDKMQALLQNNIGEGVALKRHGVSFDEVDTYIRKHMTHDPFILELYDYLLAESEEKKIFGERKD